MKQVILKQLRLLNFKGIRDLTIDFEVNTNIYAANEVGKSTIYTAFTWLLTGKDEFDRKDYEIKNTKNKELNSQSHEVEAMIETNEDGIEFEHKLKRVYLEKWVKQKGQSHKTFEGHKTDFWYNDVPCSLSEYQAKVDNIIAANVIKLVTNPTFFNNLKWEDQRKGLISIAGNITNRDVIEAITTPQNDYGTLSMILNAGKSLEDWKKELAAKKLLLKKASVEFVPRIDEAKRTMPEAKDWKAIEIEIAAKQDRITTIDQILSNASKALAEKQKGIMAKQKIVHSKEIEASSIRNKIRFELESKKQSGASAIENLKSQIRSTHETIQRLKKSDADNAVNIIVYENQIKAKNDIILKLRSEWSAINSEKFSFDENACECPTCKQLLPPGEIETKKAELLKNFNESVAQRKKAKVDYSNQVKAEIKQFEENIAAITSIDNAAAIQAEEGKLSSLHSRLSTAQITESKNKIEDVEAATDALLKVNADFLNIQDEINYLQTDMEKESLALEGENTNQEEQVEKYRLQSEINDLRKQLAVKETIERTELRIKQLHSDEQTNAQAIADLEQQEFEVETFTRAKMDILQQRVNGMFKYVKFRLFEIQVNGAIAETCVCEYNNVPYPTLNTAAKLLAGIDVLNTFSKYYGVYAPVFCDNRESVSWIPESKSQIISLFVSANDKVIRVEKSISKKLAVA